jgi:hypothetical protein
MKGLAMQTAIYWEWRDHQSDEQPKWYAREVRGSEAEAQELADFLRSIDTEHVTIRVSPAQANTATGRWHRVFNEGSAAYSYRHTP